MSYRQLSRSLTPRLGSLALLGAWALLGSVGCAPAQPAQSSPSAPESSPSALEPAPAANEAAATPAAPLPALAAAEPREGAQDTRSKEAIQAVLAANREKVRACYEAALENNPGIQGDLVVGFVINPDGSVKSAEVNSTESELHVPELDSCAVEALRTLQFPASSRGLESKVSYPFNFNPRKP